MTYVPPSLPSAAKPPYWTKGRKIFFGAVALAILGAAGNSNSNRSYEPRTEPVARVATPSKSEYTRDEYGYLIDKNGNLSDQHDIKLRMVAAVSMYKRHCGGKLPSDLERGAAALADGAGFEQMFRHIWIVEETRRKTGNADFCAAMGAAIRSAKL